MKKNKKFALEQYVKLVATMCHLQFLIWPKEDHYVISKCDLIKGNCPFCRADSLIVSVLRNLYYCDQCKQAGDPIAFVIAKYNCSFIEALDHCASLLKKQYRLVGAEE